MPNIEGGFIMSLINCRECGGKVSDKAIACPHCGYPLKGYNAISDNGMRKRNNAFSDTESQSLQETASVELLHHSSDSKNVIAPHRAWIFVSNFIRWLLAAILLLISLAFLFAGDGYAKLISFALMLTVSYLSSPLSKNIIIHRDHNKVFKIIIAIICFILSMSLLPSSPNKDAQAGINKETVSPPPAVPQKEGDTAQEVINKTPLPQADIEETNLEEKGEGSAKDNEVVEVEKLNTVAADESNNSEIETDYDSMTEDEYKGACDMLWYDEVFFSKENLEGDHVKLDVFVEEGKFFKAEAMSAYPISDMIKDYNIKRDFYLCGVQRQDEDSYVGEQIYVFFSDDYGYSASDFTTGNHLIIYGEIIHYAGYKWEGYNECYILPRYIEYND